MVTEERTGSVEAAGRTLVGYASVWGAEANIGGEFIETFERGAFADAVKGDVRLLFGHDHGRPLCRAGNGTLRLEEDDHGLRIEADVPNTPDGDTVLELVRLRTISGMSVAFSPKRESWTSRGVGLPLRTIREAGLREVSVVTWPAYEATQISVSPAKSIRHFRLDAVEKKFVADARARMKRKLDAAIHNKTT